MLNLARSVLIGATLLAGVPAHAEDSSLTFLLANDIYKMEGAGDRGGFARLAGVVKAERAKGGNVIYVHAGDTISPSLMSGFDQGEHVIDLLNLAAPDIFVPGNHEFDFGPEVFARRMAALTSQKLAANLRGGDGRILDGFADTQIVEKAGIKIGIVGIAADDSPVKSTPGNLKFAPSVETALASAKALKEQGAELIVAVVHANRAQDQELFATGAFDIILSGDDHDLALFYDGRTVLAESKEEAEFVTAIDLAIKVDEKDGKRSVKWWPAFRIIDTATIEPDAETAAKTKTYEDKLSSELDVAIGKSKIALDSRKATVRSVETPIGNLIADAMREAVGAQAAITNGGGIRGNREYAAGSTLTRRDVLTELPFGNRTWLIEIRGADILAALENGVSKVEEAAGRFPHLSGIAIEADLSKPAGSRIVSASIGGAPIDATKLYKLATNDFMAKGGDGYGALKKGKPLLGERDAKLMANDVMAYVKARGEVEPVVEGRVKLMQ